LLWDINDLFIFLGGFCVFGALGGFRRGMDSHDDPFLTSKPAATARHHCCCRHHHRSFVAGLIDRQRTIGAVCLAGGNDNNRETFFKAQMGLGEAAFIGVGTFFFVDGTSPYGAFRLSSWDLLKKNTRFNLFCPFLSFFFRLFAVRLAAYTAQLSHANPIARSLLHLALSLSCRRVYPALALMYY